MAAPRSIMLVTQGSEPALAAALASDADVICVDLEDTVTDKVAARVLAARFLGVESRGGKALRINGMDTPDGLRDILWLRELPRRPDLVMLPMVRNAAEPKMVAGLPLCVALLPIIETAEGIEHAVSIVRATPAVMGLTLGGKDLSLDLGTARDWDGLYHGRCRVVQAAASGGVPAFDEPYRPLDDLPGLALNCARVAALGFRGKAAVDVRHIGSINATFARAGG
jgi:(S)-citramalyl-CoA lyase